MLAIILLVVLIVSLMALIGVFTIPMKTATLSKFLFVAVSFAAGSLLGAAFLDLIPEAISELPHQTVFGAVLLGILVSFAVEKFLYHYHCHVGHKCEHPHRPKSYTYLSLIGDAIHNFLDGMIIAVSFVTSFETGVTASIAVIAHEIPQEIGDFALLIKGGFTRKKALIYNFLTALTAFLGAILAYYFSKQVQGFSPILAAFAGGTFIYIAACDLIPELHHEEKASRSTIQTIMILLGILVIWAAHLFFDG
ncbi:MAG: ZIP family metal transporter [Nanoarchaeota archaeon]